MREIIKTLKKCVVEMNDALSSFEPSSQSYTENRDYIDVVTRQRYTFLGKVIGLYDPLPKSYKPFVSAFYKEVCYTIFA